MTHPAGPAAPGGRSAPGAWDLPGEPVLAGRPWADAERLGRSCVKDPSVVRFRGTCFLYFSVPPATGSGTSGWRVGVATSTDLTSWVTRSVIDPLGDDDSLGLAAAGAIVLDERVHLFYQTYGHGAGDSICHASSADGLHFVPDETNPVFAPTRQWTCGRAIDADVIAHEGRLWMAYATRDPQMKVQMVGVASAPLGGDYGRTSWVDHSQDGPALRPELAWEQDCIEAPAFFHAGSTLGMFYAGAYNNAPQQIGWATSSDGIHWQRGSASPLIASGPAGAWNSSESGHPGYFEDVDGAGYLFFQGNDDDGRTWGIAATRITWVDGAPVVERHPDLQVPAPGGSGKG